MRQALGKVESLRPYFYPAAPGKDYASYVHSVVNSITTGSAQALETAISQQLQSFRLAHSENIKKELAALLPKPVDQEKVDMVREYQKKKGVPEQDRMQQLFQSFQALSTKFDKATSEAKKKEIARLICRPLYNCTVTPQYEVFANEANKTITVEVTYIARTFWRKSNYLSPRFKNYVPDDYYESRESEIILGKKSYTMRYVDDPPMKTLQQPQLEIEDDEVVDMEGIEQALDDYEREDFEKTLTRLTQEVAEFRAASAEDKKLIQQLKEDLARETREKNISRMQLNQVQRTLSQLQAAADKEEGELLPDQVSVNYPEKFSTCKDVDLLFTRHGKVWFCVYSIDYLAADSIVLFSCGHMGAAEMIMPHRLATYGNDKIEEDAAAGRDPTVLCPHCKMDVIFRTPSQIYTSLANKRWPFGVEHFASRFYIPTFTAEEISNPVVDKYKLYKSVMDQFDVYSVQLFCILENTKLDFPEYFAKVYRKSSIAAQKHWDDHLGVPYIKAILEKYKDQDEI